MNKNEFKYISLIKNEMKIYKKLKGKKFKNDDSIYDFAFSKSKEIFKFYSYKDLKYELNKLHLCIKCNENQNANIWATACVFISSGLNISAIYFNTSNGVNEYYQFLLLIICLIVLFGAIKLIRSCSADNIIICNASINAIKKLIQEKQKQQNSTNKIGTLEYQTVIKPRKRIKVKVKQ